VQESKGIIKALHLFDLHGNPSNYRHSQTIIVHNNGFRFIVLGVSDEVANRRTQTIMQRVENKRLERERAGDPFNFEDYLSISQMGLLARFVGSSNTYPDSNNLEDVIQKERLILEKGAKYEDSQVAKVKSEKKLSDLIFPPMTPEINSDVLQVFEDYPSLVDEFTEGVPDINSPGMVEFLFAKLGSVDPNGPNGWFLELFDSEGNLKP
jgi:hypothetical protein